MQISVKLLSLRNTKVEYFVELNRICLLKHNPNSSYSVTFSLYQNLYSNLQRLLKQSRSGRKHIIYPISMSFFVLAVALFMYYIFVPTGTEARTEVK